MTTTGELRAIIEELELEDVGDADSYLGEDSQIVDDFVETASRKFVACFNSFSDELVCKIC